MRCFGKDLLYNSKPLRFHLSKARLAHDDKRHQIDIDLSLPEDAGEVQLSAEINGTLDNPNTWAAQFYAAGNNLLLPALAKHHQPETHLLQQGTVDFKLWGRWQAGGIDQVLGQLGLQNLQLLHTPETESKAPKQLNIEQLAGHFKWQKTAQDWRFDMADFTFQRTGRPLQKRNISIVNQDNNLQIELGRTTT